MKKYQVPARMLNAAVNAIDEEGRIFLSRYPHWPGMEACLRLALSWLSENPIVAYPSSSGRNERSAMNTYVIPKGMLDAATEAYTKVSMKVAYPPFVEVAIEAALRWAAENPPPIFPDDAMIHEFYAGECEAGVSFEFLRRFWRFTLSHAYLASSINNERTSTTPISDLMEQRVAEYHDWIWNNLERSLMGKELLPRLDWDKKNAKMPTFKDVANKHGIVK